MTAGAATTIPLSVIVISRGRPDDLSQCLMALRLQDHPAIEVVVVADPAGIAVARSVLGETFRAVPHDRPGVAAARNAGLVKAACDVIAFIDDDAVAEPTWARRLSAPFAAADVMAACGPVRGPRGIELQWTGCLLDECIAETPLAAPVDRTSLHPSQRGRVVVTIGTNCAFRRDAVLSAGGFDPAFRYFLDESDLNARLALAGAVTAYVPDAVVQHRPASNATRTADHTIADLFEIGRSTAVFLSRHADQFQQDRARRMQRDRQRARLLRQMVAGRILPDRVGPVLATFDAGFREGAALPPHVLPPLMPAESRPVFLASTGARQAALLAGRPWQRRALRRKARVLAAAGQIVTVLVLSPTFLPHRAGFVAGGWWEQHGGLFRAAEPATAKPRFRRFASRVQEEVRRIALTRPA